MTPRIFQRSGQAGSVSRISTADALWFRTTMIDLVGAGEHPQRLLTVRKAQGRPWVDLTRPPLRQRVRSFFQERSVLARPVLRLPGIGSRGRNRPVERGKPNRG